MYWSDLNGKNLIIFGLSDVLTDVDLKRTPLFWKADVLYLHWNFSATGPRCANAHKENPSLPT